MGLGGIYTNPGYHLNSKNQAIWTDMDAGSDAWNHSLYFYLNDPTTRNALGFDTTPANSVDAAGITQNDP